VEERYELCVIGAGTAGFAAAEAGHELGRRTIVVSGPGDLGGTCILRGCMPAKTLLSSTQRLGAIEGAADLGIEPEHVAIDIPKILARKRELVDYFAEDRILELERYPLVRGCARFIDPGSIEVDGRRIAANRFVIATGSHIVAPAIPGLHEAGFITSDGALELTEIPPSIALIGGGPVGCEFSQYFARLGSTVVLLQSEDELLRYEDADIGAATRAALERDGVTVVCGARITGIATSGAGPRITYEAGGLSHEVSVARVMLTTGRVPNVRGLGLAAAGIETGARGGITVDAELRTTNSAVYAAGDVLGRRCLVHVAEYAGRLAARNAFARQPARADFDRFEAHAVYTQPQVAVAGLTERALAARGTAVRVRRHPFSDIGKALVSNEARGFVKMLVDDEDRLCGVAVFSDDAIDLIGEAIALIDRGATAREVAEMPHLHPTMGEIFGRVADGFSRARAT
jgi:pyruvate/2-oxoglutarate dehydrogenase complex dihydrolipoamide dehydrogenase (E3) component